MAMVAQLHINKAINKNPTDMGHPKVHTGSHIHSNRCITSRGRPAAITSRIEEWVREVGFALVY